MSSKRTGRHYRYLLDLERRDIGDELRESHPVMGRFIGASGCLVALGAIVGLAWLVVRVAVEAGK